MLWPNLLTTLRILLTPVIGLLLLHHAVWWAVGCYGVAALTDFADGFVATRWNAKSLLGAALDPLADKILVLVTMFFMAANGTFPSHWMLWACVLMMIRELLVLGLRSVLGSQVLPVIPMAKLKTTFQMLALPFVMLWPLYGSNSWFCIVGYLLIILSTLLSVHSGCLYGLAAYHFLTMPSAPLSSSKNQTSELLS